MSSLYGGILIACVLYTKDPIDSGSIKINLNLRDINTDSWTSKMRDQWRAIVKWWKQFLSHCDRKHDNDDDGGYPMEDIQLTSHPSSENDYCEQSGCHWTTGTVDGRSWTTTSLILNVSDRHCWPYWLHDGTMCRSLGVTRAWRVWTVQWDTPVHELSSNVALNVGNFYANVADRKQHVQRLTIRRVNVCSGGD